MGRAPKAGVLRLLALLALVAAGAASDDATVSADLTIFGTGTVPCTQRVHAVVMAAVPDALPGILVVGIRLTDPKVRVPQPVRAAALLAAALAAAQSAVLAPAAAPQLGALTVQGLCFSCCLSSWQGHRKVGLPVCRPPRPRGGRRSRLACRDALFSRGKSEVG